MKNNQTVADYTDDLDAPKTLADFGGDQNKYNDWVAKKNKKNSPMQTATSVTVSSDGNVTIKADKIEVQETTPTSPKWNMAADLIIAAFSKLQDSKRFADEGNVESATSNRRTAVHMLLNAMEAPGATELMFSLNQVNAAADLPDELDEDLGIDPEDDEFSWLDDDDYGPDDEDEDDDEDSDDDDDEGTEEDGSEEASLSNGPKLDRSQIAMANHLSFSGKPEDRRLALKLLGEKK